MAKHSEKIYVKKINVACLLFALALVILSIFAYSTLSSNLEVEGVDLEYITDLTSNPEALGEYLSANTGVVLGFIVLLVSSVVSIVALINVIRLVVGWFGFIGKKDSRRMAKKLAKHAKIAFGTTGLILATEVILCTSKGVIAGNVKTLAIVTGAAFAIAYLLVRYYRWFVVEKVSYKSYVFLLIRDAICIALPIILFSFVSLTAVKDGIDAMNSFTSAATSQRRLADVMGRFIMALVDLFILVGVFGIVKKILKLMPFDNYKKKATKAASGKYIPLIIISLLLIASSAITTTVIKYEAFEVNAFKEAFFAEFDIIIKLVLTAIAAHVLNTVESEGNEGDEVKLAIAAPAAEDAPAEEAAPDEEAAPAVEDTPAKEGSEAVRCHPLRTCVSAR